MKTVDDCLKEALEESPYGILTYEVALETARKFASIYAEEKLREKLIAFCRKYIPAELIGDEIILIDEYLKSRER